MPKKMKATEVKQIRSSGYFSFYTNNARIGFSGWDVRVTFADLGEGDDRKPLIKDITTAIMSPPHAKALLNALVEGVKKYEHQFGEIKIPGQTQGKS